MKAAGSAYLGHPFISSGFGVERPGPRSGSDCVFIKNQSEPDFGPVLPVRPTKHESVGGRPEAGPSAFLRIVVFLKHHWLLVLGDGGPARRPARAHDTLEFAVRK